MAPSKNENALEGPDAKSSGLDAESSGADAKSTDAKPSWADAKFSWAGKSSSGKSSGFWIGSKKSCKAGSGSVPGVPFPRFVEVEREAEIIRSPKLTIGRHFSSLFEAYTAVVSILDDYGRVVAISVTGMEPFLKVSVEYSKVRETEEAVENLDFAEFSLDEPKRIRFCEETIRVYDFKASIPQLFQFMLNELETGITKVYVSPDEDKIKFVDLSLCGAAKKISDSLTKESLVFPWGGRVEFSLGSPFYSVNTIEPVDLLTGRDERKGAILENLPSNLTCELLKDELSFRLQQVRFVTLNEIISSFELTGGTARIVFKTPEFLHLFYEEFEGYKFQRFVTVSAMDQNLKQAKCFRLRFS